MNTRRGTTASLVATISVGCVLIASVIGTPQIDAPGVGPVGTVAVASAESASDVTYAIAGDPGQQTVVFDPGTGNPGEKASLYAGAEYVVPYPAATPVIGNYPDSVVQGGNGAADAARAPPPGSRVVISGFSQGAQAARLAAAQPGVVSDHRVIVVTTGDPCTEGTGILVRFPLAQAATGNVPCNAIPEGAEGVVINHAQDQIANFPSELNGMTVVNALVEYSYYHANGYGPVDLNQTDVQSYTVGNVTYVTIPRDKTPALVRLAHDYGIPVSPEVEAWIAAATYRPDPGPLGAFAPASSVHEAAAPVAASEIPVVRDPVTQAAETVNRTWQQDIVEPFTQQVEDWANGWSAPVSGSVTAPTGNVAAIADMAQAVLPPESAGMVDQMATGVQNSPLGEFINGLPRL